MGVLLEWLYGHAAGMTWQFDDLANLKELGGVSTREGLLQYLFGGVAGPGGRPLSLLAFLPNYADWDGNPWGFARGTLLLHGLNALLATLLFTQLWRSVADDVDCRLQVRSPLVWGTLAAVLWAAQAIHASGILMPVQRMTHVSGFFVLLTLWLYVMLRRNFAGAPGWWPLIALSGTVGVGTVLAVLGKENGALTVSLVAVIESLWLCRLTPPAPRAVWRAWVWLAWLVVPVFLIGTYLLRGWAGLMASYRYYRPFSLMERLATEPVVLWEYVRQALAPRAALLGPLQDGHAIYDWAMWQPWVAVAAWIVVVLAAAAWVRIGGLLARATLLAIVFFLVAHQIESTFIPLELYFEHRNYIATLCIAFCLAVAIRTLWSLAPSLSGRVVAMGVAITILAWQCLAIYQLSTLIGQPLLAAEMWHRYHPTSQRAAQTLAWQLGQLGFLPAGLRVLDELADRQPDQVGVRIQALALACKVQPENEPDHRHRMSVMQRDIGMLRSASGFVTGLQELGTAVRAEKCRGADAQDYFQFLQLAVANEAIQHTRQVRHHVNFELSLTASKLGLIQQAVLYGKQAFYDFPSVGSGQRVATLLFTQGELEEAIAWTEEAEKHAPNGIQRWAWHQNFGSMRAALEDIRNHLHDANQ